MNVDIVGIEAVANLIRQSNLTKFVIQRAGAMTNSAPVFEHLQGNQNKRAVDSFVEWARNVLNSNPANSTPYEILLFNDDGGTDDGTLDLDNPAAAPERIKRGKAKRDKLRIYFALSSASSGSIGNPGADYIRRDDMQKIISEALEKNELLRTNEELKQRVAALEKGDVAGDDYEEEDESGDILGRLENLFGKLGFLGNEKKEEKLAAVSGAPEAKTPEQQAAIKANIQNAIKRLFKVNAELDRDLLKLADLAEKQPEQFKFLLSALRRM